MIVLVWHVKTMELVLIKLMTTIVHVQMDFLGDTVKQVRIKTKLTFTSVRGI